MDKQFLDSNLESLASSVRTLQWEREPEEALRACVAEVADLARSAPPELQEYLVDRLEPVVATYGIDAGRLVQAQRLQGESAGEPRAPH